MPFFSKIAYYKNTLDERFAPYVDKIEAKKIVKAELGEQIRIPKIVRILKDPNDFNKGDINPNHMVKAAHGSGWNINMTSISDPVLCNMRMLGMMKLLYIYGGMFCPLSFVCLKNLNNLYLKGTRGEKMFVCETVDRNVSSTDVDFYPNLSFCGAPKECETVRELCNFIQRTSSHDYTADVKFLGDYDKWCKQKIANGRMNMIEGVEIGTKTIDERQVVVDDLISNNYLDLYQGTYGILIPADEILNRVKFEWFARLSPKQVLESDTIIGNYILLSQTCESGVLEPLEPMTNKAIENKFVGFWKTPLQDVWGLKPDNLGDNMSKVQYARR
jgi:hypothetical protein